MKLNFLFLFFLYFQGEPISSVFVVNSTDTAPPMKTPSFVQQMPAYSMDSLIPGYQRECANINKNIYRV